MLYKEGDHTGQTKIGLYLDLGVFLVLTIAGIFIIWPLFTGGVTANSGSIESVFLADARWYTEHFFSRWNPFWYTGFPSHLTYTPLLPYLIVFTHKIFSFISIAGIYRFFIGFFYVITPFTFYLFTKYLIRSRLLGLLAATFYLLLPSPIALVNSGWASQVAENFHAPWQLLTMILYGEGPHVAGLAFTPLAMLFFLKTLRKENFANIFWAAIFISLVALTNWIALVGLIFFLALLFFCEIIFGKFSQKLGSVLKIFLLTIIFTAFWFNFSFVASSFAISSGGEPGNFLATNLKILPLWLVIIPILLFVILLVVGKKKQYFPYVFVILSFFILAVIIWLFFHTRQSFLPQPNRYALEAQFAFCWLLVLIIGLIYQKLRPTIQILLTCLIIAVICYLARSFIFGGKNLVLPKRNINQVAEYQMTQKLLQINPQKERTYLTGSYAFWINAFEDFPQIRGGNDGIARKQILDAIYQINTGENAGADETEIGYAWLRILNTNFLVFNTNQSPEIFHDFKNPEKFENFPKMEKIEEFNGDIYYYVKMSQPQLAQAVNKDKFFSLRPLYNAIDQENLYYYANYIDDPDTSKDVNFSWEGTDQAIIDYNLADNEAIGVQISYNRGWKAYRSDGKKIKIKKDIMGYIYLDPGTNSGRIILKYKNTWDVYLGYIISFFGIIGIFFWYFTKKQKINN